MPVKALRDDYHGEMKGRVENYHGQQLFSILWDQHLMFATPYCFTVDPDSKFGEIVHDLLPGLYGHHPDFAQIDWNTAGWIMSGKPFKPDFDKSIADNGIPHKAVVRFRTPELTGLQGTYN